MTPQDVLHVIRARWLTVVLVLAGVFMATLLASLLMPRQYVAYASVVADTKIDPVAAAVAPAQSLASYIATQVDIINSERVARRAVEIVAGREDSPTRRQWERESGEGDEFEDWLGGGLTGRLVVAPSRESNVINVGVRWEDAEAAAELANAFAQAYIDVSIQLKVEPARQYASWFNERAKELRAELEERRKALSDFQRDSGIIATDERLDIETARLSELSSQLLAIQAARQDAQSRQAARGDLESLPEVLQSATVNALKSQLATAELRRNELLSRLGTGHPDYQLADAEVTSLRERIDAEIRNVASSIGTTARVNQRRENDVAAAFEAQKQRVLQLRRERDMAADLQLEVLNAQRNLDAVNQRLAQSTLESLTQQSNVLPLTTASVPVFPASPRIKLNLALALVLGTLAGIGTALLVESRDRRIRMASDLPQRLQAPLLGVLSDGRRRPRAPRPLARVEAAPRREPTLPAKDLTAHV